LWNPDVPAYQLKFTHRDITRAVKAMKAAGVEIGRIEMDHDGKIVIIPKGGATTTATSSEWDDFANGTTSLHRRVHRPSR
jgi:hypothetical protein